MRSKFIKSLFAVLCIFFMINSVSAKSLKQLRDELAKDIARQDELIAEQKAKQKKIDAANKEVGQLANKINANENKVEDAKGKKFEDVPVLYRIKNDRRYNYAKELIDMVMGKLGVEKGDEPNEDYRIPYEETMPLLKKGLIKELKVRVKDKNEPASEPAPEPEPEPAPVEEPVEEEKPVEEVHHIEIPAHLEHVSVQEADAMMSDEVAEEVIVIKKSKVKHMGKKEVINLDMLSKHFNDGDVVDLESLKEKKLINAKTDYIKVLARGVLDKKLTVKADDFSLQAVKMIALMGGTVKEYK